MRIKAAVVPKVGDKFIIKDDVELAPLEPDELQVHMVASGICHSDEALRKGDAGWTYPTILGHEGSGIVEKVGANVTQFAPGDHIVMAFYSDGTCVNCMRGIPTQCLSYAKYNLSGFKADGKDHFTEAGNHVADMFAQSSFTTTTTVRERNCVKVDKSLDLRRLGPLGCGFETGAGTVFNTLKPQAGTTIAVYGTGAVGMAAMMAGAIVGCSRVIAIDVVPERLALAKECGATDTINSKEQDTQAELMKITDGLGVDFAVDTTGIKSVMQGSIDGLAIGGTAALIAVTPQLIEVSSWNDLCVADKKVIGVNMGDSIPQRDVPRLIRYFEMGKFPFDKTEKFYKFDDINQANEDSVNGKTIKPVLVIDEDYVPGK